jgi:hypothetical protein
VLCSPSPFPPFPPRWVSACKLPLLCFCFASLLHIEEAPSFFSCVLLCCCCCYCCVWRPCAVRDVHDTVACTRYFPFLLFWMVVLHFFFFFGLCFGDVSSRSFSQTRTPLSTIALLSVLRSTAKGSKRVCLFVCLFFRCVTRLTSVPLSLTLRRRGGREGSIEEEAGGRIPHQQCGFLASTHRQ